MQNVKYIIKNRDLRADVLIFVCITAFSFLLFQQSDLCYTATPAVSLLNGHIFDFYDYNANFPGATNYMPSIYIIFAIWNIPLRLLGIVTEPMSHYDLSTVATMWYKILPATMYLITAYIIYKILINIGFSEKRSKLGSILFLTMPVAFFSQFIFGQTDIFTVFFMLLGLYYYFQNDNKKFILFFGIACTFKYFPLYIFFPLLLLKEKRIEKIFASTGLVFVPMIIEVLPFLHSGVFKEKVLGFSAAAYNFTLNAALTIYPNSINLVIATWLVLCAFAYFKTVNGKIEIVKWAIYYGNIAIFIVFGLSPFHPNWLLWAVPFWVIGSLLHKKLDVHLVLDLIFMVVMCIYIVNTWSGNLDQTIMQNGIFGGLITDTIGNNITMSGIYKYTNMNMVRTFITAILAVFAFFKHPKYQLQEINDEYEKNTNLSMKAILRVRFLVGILFFIIPACICFVDAYAIHPYKNTYEVKSEENEGSAGSVGPVLDYTTFSQVFNIDEDNICKIDYYINPQEYEDDFNLIIEIQDMETDEVLYTTRVKSTELNQKDAKNTLITPKIAVVPNRAYAVKFRTEGAYKEDNVNMVTYPKDDNRGFAFIDGIERDFDLKVDVFSLMK